VTAEIDRRDAGELVRLGRRQRLDRVGKILPPNVWIDFRDLEPVPLVTPADRPCGEDGSGAID